MEPWIIAEYTDTGSVRSINEDSIFSSTGDSIWAVADGMGGHEGGDYASQYVVNALSHYRKTAHRGISLSRLNSLLESSNAHLVEKAHAEHRGIIGCTVAVLTAHENHLICSWSGDSRVYRVRNNELRHLTRDHSYESLSEDRDLVHHPEVMLGDPQMLTSAIGGEEITRVEHCCYSLQSGDRFVICTDGLYKEATDDEIGHSLRTHDKPQLVVDELSAIYHQRGARDNVGIVCVYYQ